MGQFYRILLISGFLVSGAFAQVTNPTPPVKEDEVVRISTNLIRLDVSITDKSGKSIGDLRPDEIAIYENGERQKITHLSFVSSARSQGAPATAKATAADKVTQAPRATPSMSASGVRRTIALVVDDLTLSYESMNLVRRSLKKFVDQQMQDGDMVTIIRTGAGSGVLQQFTSDKRILHAAIESVRFNPLGRGRIGAFEAITDVPQSLKDPKYGGEDSGEEKLFKKSFEDFRESVLGTGTLSTLKFMVSAMRELPGRKSVILFSDGFSIFQRDEHGYTEGGKVVEVLRLLVEAANRASVVFYTVDSRTLQNPDVQTSDSISLPMNITKSNVRLATVATERTKELFDTQGGLDHLAKETGGFSIKNQNDLNEGIERVLLDQSYYLVGYEPDTDTFDAKTRKFNKIEVKVKRDGATVRYRSGFFAMTDENLIKPQAKTSAKNQQLESVITSPFAATNISLRLNTIFGNREGGDYVTPLLNINAGDLKFTDTANGEKRVILEVLAMSFGANGVPIERTGKTVTFDIKPDLYSKILASGLVLHFNFPVKSAGGHQFRVAVRDKQADTIGTASQFIEIPDLKKKKLEMSGILLENLTSEQWSNLAGQIRKASSELSVSDGTDPMNDTSLRKFGRNTVLRYGFEIYNAGMDGGKLAELYTRIKVFKDGVQVLDGQDLPLDATGQTDLKRIQGGGAMNLPRDMPAGNYILQILVTDGRGKNIRQITTQSVEFEIIG